MSLYFLFNNVLFIHINVAILTETNLFSTNGHNIHNKFVILYTFYSDSQITEVAYYNFNLREPCTRTSTSIAIHGTQMGMNKILTHTL